MGKFHVNHPRLRGNHATSATLSPLSAGSPPLTREPLLLGRNAEQVTGITPAYAGTTPSRSECGAGHRDHPRLRGNHDDALYLFLAIGGSPPLTREPPAVEPSVKAVLRITPAYAGTT